MFSNTFNQMSELLIQIIIAMLLAVVFFRTSHFLFGISLIEEVKNKNQAAAIFSAGIMLLIALVVGLFKV